MQPEDREAINIFKEETKYFFINYPEAHKITGMSLKDVREMEVYEFDEIRELVKEHYEWKKKYPDVVERLLLEFREYARLSLGGKIYDTTNSTRRSAGSSD